MSPWIEVTGWTLIHFVWQGTLLALATAAALGACRRSAADIRYAIACLGLAAMLATAAATAVRGTLPGNAAFLSADQLSPAGRLGTPIEASIGAEGTLPSAASQAVRAASSSQLLSIVVWIWLAGVTSLDRPARRRMLARPSPARRDHRGTPLLMAVDRRTSRPPPARRRAVPDRRVGGGRRADPDRLAAAPDHPAARRDGAHDGRPGRSAPRSRARAHPPPRLRDQPAADDRRSAVVLPSCRLVDLEAHPPGARALLRRRRHRGCGGSDGVRRGVDGAGVVARTRVPAVARGRERPAGAPHSAAAQRRRRREPAVGSRRIDAARNRGHSRCGGDGPGSRFVGNRAGRRARRAARTGACARPIISRSPTLQSLDLHAERIADEAERAYERVSVDLRHSLGFKIPLVLFESAADLERGQRTGAANVPLARRRS